MVTARGGQEGAPQTEAFGIDPMFKLEGAGGRKIGNERSAVQAVGIGDRSAAEGLLELVNIHSQPRGERQPIAVANQDLGAEGFPETEDRLAQGGPSHLALPFVPEQFHQGLAGRLPITGAGQVGEHGQDLGRRERHTSVFVAELEPAEELEAEGEIHAYPMLARR